MRLHHSALLLAFALFGCARPPGSYRLLRQGPTVILQPPVTVPRVQLKNARTVRNASCDIDQHAVRLHWTGRTAHLEIARPADLIDAEGRPFLASENQMNEFRAQLIDLQQRGCLTAGEARALLQAAVERFPLPVYVAFGLRYGSYANTGFIDLTPEFALEIVSPAGAGYETARYALHPSGNQDQVAIRLDSIDGKPAAAAPASQWFHFPESVHYFRLLFLISRSAADHEAIVIGAPDPATLQAATLTVQAHPEEACHSPKAYACAAVPRNSAINPQLRIAVHGQPAFVALGSTLRELTNRGIHDVSKLNQVPPGLEVRRLYAGRPASIDFDAASKDILSLVLMPGDEITWDVANP